MWRKSATGRMEWFNAAFITYFLNPRNVKPSDYLGANDYQVWPKGIAHQFRKADKWVMQTGLIFAGAELTEVEPGIFEEVRAIKFPFRGGTFGVAIPAALQDTDAARHIENIVLLKKLERRERELTAVLNAADSGLN